MATSSVSKGCFVFKPNPRKRKKVSTIEDYFVESSHGEVGKERLDICQRLWDLTLVETGMLQDELNRKILDSLLEFLRKSASNFQSQQDDWATRMRSNEIPTAALMLGVNVPDHDMTFQNLTDLLQKSITPFVVSVQAKECSALKHLMQKVLERLIGVDVSMDDEDDDGGPHNTPVHQRRVHCSLNSLCDWYAMVTKKYAATSPGKTCTLMSKPQLSKPPIVVIFKDLEAFHPQVLQDFTVICSRYIQTLPLMFVFGIATSPSTIQHMLPHSVSSLLCIELFQSLSCTQHLATVTDKLVLNHKFPFKLTGKMLQVLVSIFLYHDFSVRNFIKGFQLALVEHFHSQPLSILCCPKKEALAHAQKLSHQDIERIRQLPSFMRHVENQEPQKQVELLTNDERVKEECQTLVKSLRRYHKNYYPVLRCLHSLTFCLPKHPLGKQIRELHISCLEKSIWETEEYQTAMQYLKLLAKDELITNLQKCLDILINCKSKKMQTALKQLQNYLEKFNQLDRLSAEELIQEALPEKDLQKKTDLFQLKKTLLEMKESRRTKKMTPFEILRNQVLDFVDTLVRTHLAPPESQPLNEIYYYGSSGVIRKHLNATPRTALQTALSHPHFYLQHKDLQTEDGTVSNAAPDICIVYKLHLECGRLINLYDWLEAYSTVVSAVKDSRTNDDSKVDELKHARFIQAVSELEFLGFVKSTKQKTDHVARLTWGGC